MGGTAIHGSLIGRDVTAADMRCVHDHHTYLPSESVLCEG